ncbi:glycylpeptide N-tetradecanoyltransferase 1b [Boleophthalmus pectinirostris]|uniref:glycylpeptide N-tetradecanoyltransferase 1b n=1 Tax=Boleophthalmus pectinirostris TaxID=150288 RepID=UPI000A1C52CC|nr:glycylpeptide N-tetradecanoyltransferase 1b [Boleophthalmus pectinirostris]
MMASKDEKQQTQDESSAAKKTKKHKKREDNWRPQGPRDPFAMLNELPEEKQQELQRALHLFNLGPTLPRTLEQAKKHQYRFWDTQPVPKLDGAVTSHGPIAVEERSVRTEPYSLPQGFSWDTLNLSSAAVLKELCTLLSENFTQDDDNTIRLGFSEEYLKWALQCPQWLPQWHCGVRVHSNKKLVGFIAAVPADVKVYDKEIKMVQVRLLCVHKKLRLKRMTPVLIRELTRRVNQQGTLQALYTADIVLPTPLSTCKYWHRPLNPRKLMDLNYSGVKQNIGVQTAVKINKLPDVIKTQGLRPMTTDDIAAVHSLLQSNKSMFDLSTSFSVEEVEHWLLPRENLVYSYVIQGEDGGLTGAFSFYGLSSKVLNHFLHTELREAQLLFCICSSADPVELMQDALILAKKKGFDIFRALDVMDNKSFLEKLKFNISSNSLNFYLYNWQCPTINPDKVGFVLAS